MTQEMDFAARLEKIKQLAKNCGIPKIIASGLVRSSYNAAEAYENTI